jgi:hypothetical protein
VHPISRLYLKRLEFPRWSENLQILISVYTMTRFQLSAQKSVVFCLSLSLSLSLSLFQDRRETMIKWLHVSSVQMWGRPGELVGAFLYQIVCQTHVDRGSTGLGTLGQSQIVTWELQWWGLSHSDLLEVSRLLFLLGRLRWNKVLVIAAALGRGNFLPSIPSSPPWRIKWKKERNF